LIDDEAAVKSRLNRREAGRFLKNLLFGFSHLFCQRFAFILSRYRGGDGPVPHARPASAAKKAAREEARAEGSVLLLSDAFWYNWHRMRERRDQFTPDFSRCGSLS